MKKKTLFVTTAATSSFTAFDIRFNSRYCFIWSEWHH